MRRRRRCCFCGSRPRLRWRQRLLLQQLLLGQGQKLLGRCLGRGQSKDRLGRAAVQQGAARACRSCRCGQHLIWLLQQSQLFPLGRRAAASACGCGTASGTARHKHHQRWWVAGDVRCVWSWPYAASLICCELSRLLLNNCVVWWGLQQCPLPRECPIMRKGPPNRNKQEQCYRFKQSMGSSDPACAGDSL